MSFWLKVLLFWPFVTYAKEHQRCLRHIDELERDLFPEWFPMPGWGKAEIDHVFPMRPGAIIQIPAGATANYFQILRNFYPCASSTNSNVTYALRNPKSQWHPVGAGK